MSDTQDSINSIALSTHHPPIPLTPAQRKVKQKKFLEAYGEVGIVKYACKVAGINRSTYKYWRDHDEAFAAQLPDTKDDANESLEMIAYEQARGIEEPAVSMGRIVYEEVPDLDNEGKPRLDKHNNPIMKRGKMLMVKKYSPSVLITLLKANMPEKYKEKSQVEHMGKDGGPIEVSAVRERIVQKITAIKQGMAFQIDEVS